MPICDFHILNMKNIATFQKWAPFSQVQVMEARTLSWMAPCCDIHIALHYVVSFCVEKDDMITRDTWRTWQELEVHLIHCSGSLGHNEIHNMLRLWALQCCLLSMQSWAMQYRMIGWANEGNRHAVPMGHIERPPPQKKTIPSNCWGGLSIWYTSSVRVRWMLSVPLHLLLPSPCMHPCSSWLMWPGHLLTAPPHPTNAPNKDMLQLGTKCFEQLHFFEGPSVEGSLNELHGNALGQCVQACCLIHCILHYR